ncbi:class I SAM-dependent methyltransferase [Azospirillum doebereinerae]|uniref:class I SAM-dependent methyltransferase n=1 Tax=Azospirillum doebereinerae TaxID=92933 RepID=UPI0038510D76
MDGKAGLVLEIGLGKGRTYDHLRSLFPPRDILVFDMWRRVPQELVPDADRLFTGDFQETLAAAAGSFGRCARLAHADFGSTDRQHDARQAERLAPRIDALMLPGGIVLSDRLMERPGWQPLTLPNTERWPYFAWRVDDGAGEGPGKARTQSPAPSAPPLLP